MTDQNYSVEPYPSTYAGKPLFSAKNEDGGFRPHKHDYYEIVLFLSDNILHTVNGQQDAVRRGDLFILRPGDVHAARPIDGNAPHELRDLYVEPSLFESACDFLSPALFAVLRGMETAPRTHVSEYVVNTVEEHLRFPLYLDPVPFQMGLKEEIDAMQRSMLTLLLNSFFKRSFLEKQRLPTCVLKLIDALQTTSFRSKSIEEMATELGYSREYLSREFRKAFNISLTQYLMEMRVKRAAGQLAETDMPIKAIMLDNGWRNAAPFFTAFRKYYGTDPKTYRKTHTEPMNRREY